MPMVLISETDSEPTKVELSVQQQTEKNPKMNKPSAKRQTNAKVVTKTEPKAKKARVMRQPKPKPEPKKRQNSKKK